MVSVEQHRYRLSCNILIIIMLFFLVEITLFVIFMGYAFRNETECLPEMNRTAIKTDKCNLGEYIENNLYLHVCWHEGDVIVDLREFVNGNASIKGIGMTSSEWYGIANLTVLVDKHIRQLKYDHLIFGFDEWATELSGTKNG